MSVSIVYADGGEAFYKNGTTYQVYGRTSISIPSGDNVEATGEDYFDCTGFTSNTYVFCVVMQVENTGSESSSVSLRMDVRSGSTVLSTPVRTTMTIAAGATRAAKTAIKYSVVAGYDDLNVRIMAADLDGSDSALYTFDIYSPPGGIDCYFGVGEGLIHGGSYVTTFNQKDIDQDLPSLSALDTFEPDDSTSNFYLGLCGVGSGVGCFTVYRENSYSETKRLNSITLKLQANKSGNWVDRKTKTLSGNISAGGYRGGFFEFSILPGEIWTDSSTYRVIGDWTVGTDSGSIVCQFTVSGLNIDDTQHEPGHIRIDGRHLHYTDGYGYAHEIDIGVLGSSVGAGGGYVWLEDTGYIPMRRIHYISADSRKCATAEFNSRYGGGTNVGTDKAGYIWVSSGTTASTGRYCLCMVNANGNKLRIINHGNG